MGRVSVLSFLSKDLFFLFFQEKKRKNQRKETLSGRGMSANHRAGRPPAYASCFSLRGFSKKSPAKYFCGGCVFR